MKNKLMFKTAIQFCLALFVLTAVLSSCSDDPETTNEEEVITTVTVTLTPILPDVGDAITLSWDDTNLDAIVDESEIIVSGSLKINTDYKAEIKLLNKSTDDEVDISVEVEEEAEDHLICFTKSTDLKITFDYTDEDSNGQPLGLESTWATTTAGTGTVGITLRHQPGVKTGDCPGAGETDVSLEFEIEIENPT